MTDATKPAQPPEIKIYMDDATAQGKYANLMGLAASDTEFVLDFGFLQPQNPRVRMHTRLVLSPLHVKQLHHMLADRLARFEAKHGPLVPPAGGSRDPFIH